jgi:hypothetical protein
MRALKRKSVRMRVPNRCLAAPFFTITAWHADGEFAMDDPHRH